MLLSMLILLCLNLIGILYLVFKNSFHVKTDNQTTDNQNLLEKQKKLHREMNELKGSIDYLRAWLEQDYKKLKSELQTLRSIKQEKVKPKTKQNLFLNDRYKEVFDLKEKGLSADEIAKELGKGSGEIALILQLASQDRS